MNTTANLNTSTVAATPISSKVVVASAIVACFCFGGIILNSMLVYVTWKSKNLHSRCQLLIAFSSLVAIPTLCGIGFKFFPLITGINFLPLRTCYFIQLLPLFGGPLLSSSMLCIGIDRLLCVLFPIWYKGSRKYHLGPLFMIACGIRALYRNALYFYVVSLYPEKKVMCSPGDMNQAEIGAFIYQEGLFFFWLDMGCYICIWLTILVRRKRMDNWSSMKRLMLSLTVIMAITLFGTIQAQVYRVLLIYLPVNSADTEYLVQLLSSCLYAIADSSNTPVLFSLNHEYRAAFQDTFTFLKSQPNSMHPAGGGPSTNAIPTAVAAAAADGDEVNYRGIAVNHNYRNRNYWCRRPTVMPSVQ